MKFTDKIPFLARKKSMISSNDLLKSEIDTLCVYENNDLREIYFHQLFDHKFYMKFARAKRLPGATTLWPPITFISQQIDQMKAFSL